MLLPLTSVNQSAPSGPAAISIGPLKVATGNSLKLPAIVTRPILSVLPSVNQSAPSGPAAIPSGGCRRSGSGIR